MSPIIELQRRLVEVGRIRMGERNAKGYPSRLEHWKLTSRDKMRLDAAATIYGGKVTPWEGHEGQYALHTEVDALPILLMPGQTLTSWYELWSGGGAQRRCDGLTEVLTDGPCLCDPDARECKPHTRLQVLLPDVPGLGCWRLDTSGYYAAVELAGTVDLLELATQRGALLPARLRIDQRTQIRAGQTRHFPVPTLDIDVRPLEMAGIVRGEIGRGSASTSAPSEITTTANGEAVYVPVAALPAGVSLADGLAAAEKQAEPKTRTARSAAPIGAAEEFASDEPVPVPDEGGFTGSIMASDAQIKLVLARAREAGLDDDARHALLEKTTGSPSTKSLLAEEVDRVLSEIAALDTRGGAAPRADGGLPGAAIVTSGTYAGKTLAEVAEVEGGIGWLATRLKKQDGDPDLQDGIVAYVQAEQPTLWDGYQRWLEEQA